MTVYLADTSAWAQRRRNHVAEVLGHLTVTGRLATCPVVELELLYSARNMGHYEQIKADLSPLRELTITTEVMEHALWVQKQLAQKGQHRLPVQDLIIAACAELHGATVLHNDHDFDTIAGVSNLRVQNILELVEEG